MGLMNGAHGYPVTVIGCSSVWAIDMRSGMASAARYIQAVSSSAGFFPSA
jgi:hypothetical protein